MEGSLKGNGRITGKEEQWERRGGESKKAKGRKKKLSQDDKQ